MLLRISLIVAILAGGAALYFAHVTVGDKITNLQNDLATTTAAKEKSDQDARTARAEAKKAKADFDTASKQLSDAQEKLATTTKELDAQKKHATALDQELTTVKGERNAAQDELAAWRALNIQPNQIKELQRQLKENTDAKEAFAAENKILNRKIGDLEARLARYEGNPEVAEPSGIRGTVVAVDPKYDFVVLDIGENQGVRANGQMLVSRSGKLIAKVQVTRVQPNRSIANILPEDHLGEVMEGDQVIHK